MLAYLEIPGIQGDVTTGEHKGWIQLESLHIASSRKIKMPNGQNSRKANAARLSEMELIKYADSSSTYLFQESLLGKSLNAVKIHLCHPGSPPVVFMEYELDEVFISHYEELFEAGGGRPLEIIRLNFGKIQKKFIPHDECNNPEAPCIVGFNDVTKEKI